MKAVIKTRRKNTGLCNTVNNIILFNTVFYLGTFQREPQTSMLPLLDIGHVPISIAIRV